MKEAFRVNKVSECAFSSTNESVFPCLKNVLWCFDEKDWFYFAPPNQDYYKNAMVNNCKQCFNTHYQPHCHITTKSLWLCSSVYCGPPHQSRRIWLTAEAANQKAPGGQSAVALHARPPGAVRLATRTVTKLHSMVSITSKTHTKLSTYSHLKGTAHLKQHSY